MDELYVTLGGAADAELVEKKSVFIGHAAHVDSEEEALLFIEEMRHKYADARHNVYAYMLKENNIMRYSDDKEPQGSAGIPVLDVIQKSGVTDAVVVVTRYFGGILLGKGGLVRAYSSAASLAVKAAGVVTYEPYDELEVRCDYKTYQIIKNELSKLPSVTDDVIYDADITVKFALPVAYTAPFAEKVSEISAGRCALKKTGERLGAKM